MAKNDMATLRLHYIPEPWSRPFEVEGIGEEIETLVPGRYELRDDTGEPPVVIIIQDAARDIRVGDVIKAPRSRGKKGGKR